MANFSIVRNILGITRKTWASSSYRFTQNAAALPHDSKEDLPVTLEKNPFEKERPQCILCKLNIEPDYKNVRLLSQFQSQYTGRIYGRHITGLCKNKQEKVEKEILKAQNACMMGYYTKDMKYANDPKLFDPDHPFRPHKY